MKSWLHHWDSGFPLSEKNLSWPNGTCCPKINAATKGGWGGQIRPPKRSWLRKSLPRAVPGHYVGLPALSLFSLMGSSLFSPKSFTTGHYISILQTVVYIVGSFIWIQIDLFLKKYEKLCRNLFEEMMSLEHHVAPFRVTQGRIRSPRP